MHCSVENAAHHVSMWDCLKASMRLIPTRIVIGEVRDVAAHVMLWRGIPGIPAASRAFMPIARSKRYFGLNDAFPYRAGKVSTLLFLMRVFAPRLPAS